MAKNKDKTPGQETGNPPEGIAQSGEFEDAVTTEIGDVLARALDGNQAVDPADVRITDMQLAVHIDPGADDALAPGFLLNDRFEIAELVHSGGMGHVYKAIDHRRHPGGSGNIHVAVKMMRPSVASREEAWLTLEREAAKAQALSHPNIINIFDFDHHEEQFFLVMEWLQGESVNALLRRTSGQRLAPNLAWPVIEGVAAAVQYAHEKNVVHADINPSNIFISDTGDIKLLDFGVARYMSDPDHSEDDRFAWVTQTYASPEVLSGLTPVFEDDVFSLACVAYRLLSGRHPFGGVPSLVAKHKGVLPEPVSGIAEDEWQVLRRALSFERSDRPASVSEFATRSPDTTRTGTSAGRRIRRVATALAASVVAFAALVILAGSLWLFLRGGDNVPAIEPVIDEEPVAVDVAVPSPAEALISAAARALEEGRLVAPDENNARALYRQALELEPQNAEALQGLRAISDSFVQQAQEALRLDDPLPAVTALAVATETDPANPAVDVVNQLLTARGDAELADARLAAATGNPGLAEQLLSRAEQYPRADSAAIESLRRQLAQSRQDGRLLEDLAAVNSHILAGRLILPEGENAHALLLDLYTQYGDDERVLGSMERLGERLLTRAAFAVAAVREAEASALLDAVDELGVLSSEVEAARASLATREAETGAGVAADDAVAEQRVDDLRPTPPGPDVAAGGQEPATIDEAPQATLAAAMPEPGIESELELQPAPDASAGNADPTIRRRTVQEFGIEKYVAPVFPRRARMRGITGSVDVGFVINTDGSTDMIEVLASEPGDTFSESAVRAVREWRFTPREEEIRARITMRFDMAP